MKIGFFIIAFTVILLINAYVILRGWQALLVTSSLKVYYLIAMIILFLTLIGSMIFGNLLPMPTAKYVSFVGFSYIILFIYLLISFLFVDIIRVLNHFIHFFPTGMTTFRYWFMIMSLAVIGVTMIIGNYNFNHPKIVNLNIKSSKPVQNKVIKIVAVSDIHLGISIDKDRFKSYVEMINAQHPDIVLFGGDVSDRLLEPVIRQKMDEEFRAIVAPLGVYAINGNHEHYAEKPDATANYLKSAGVIVLRDESCLVDSSFYIIGREDRSTPSRKTISELVKNLDKTKPLILLDHQPFHLEEAEDNNIDFQFSGHTHNGQFVPGVFFVNKMYELGYGFMKKGNTNYYVSSGLGLWGPQYRIGTQSELVVINFRY
ncbi:MAG: metallophosphoesterase [Paludibacter sp.]|nr:metallophosphoesterase [Paludibacter sp.]